MGAEQEKSDHRTSSTAWLHEEYCEIPLRTFAERTSALCGLPPRNMENLQVVRYHPGEEFQLHTDHLDKYVGVYCGTVVSFVYVQLTFVHRYHQLIFLDTIQASMSLILGVDFARVWFI
jgi:hypothetical protein